MQYKKNINGYAKYKNINYPFELDVNELILKLYPNEDESLEKEYEKMKDFFRKKDIARDWIQCINIEGVTRERNITINICDLSRDNYGAIEFSVNWYHIYNFSPNRKIKSVSCSCESSDIFYGIRNISTSNTEDLKEITTKITNKTTDLGSFQFKNNKVKMSTGVKWSIRYDDTRNPLYFEPCINFDFEKAISMDDVAEFANIINRFLIMITYRRNAVCCKFATISSNYRNNYGIGELTLPKMYDEEQDKKRFKYFISQQLLKDKTSDIMQMICKNYFCFDEVPVGIKDRLSFTTVRIASIFSEFEKEHNIIFGIDYERSEEYISLKDKIIKIIEENTADIKGKNKRRITEVIKGIKNSGVSFGDKIQQMMKEHKGIMESLVKIIYPNAPYHTVYENVSNRCNRLRNDIMHGNVIIDLQPDDLDKVKIVIYLIYAMRFKKARMENKESIEAIKQLFNVF